jgi:hypothetical protein
MKFGVAASMALAGALTIASGLPALSPAQAAVVDLTYNLDLNGMSTGTCPAAFAGPRPWLATPPAP